MASFCSQFGGTASVFASKLLASEVNLKLAFVYDAESQISTKKLISKKVQTDRRECVLLLLLEI